jgi:putative photosynthetic complex assembly protein
MNTPTPNPVFSKGAQYSMLALVAISLFSVWMVRQSGADIREPDAPVTQLRELRFEDRPDGSIAVIDYSSNRQIDSVVGEAGFVRGALRSMAQERKRRNLDDAKPFEVIAHQDGRVTLSDPATGRRIDLEAFGPRHSSHFVRLLTLNTNQIK